MTLPDIVAAPAMRASVATTASSWATTNPEAVSGASTNITKTSSSVSVVRI